MAQSNFPSRRSKKKRIIWPWILVFLCFFSAAIAGAFYASSSLTDKPQNKPRPSSRTQQELLTAKDKSTILIMGVDERADDVGRSDTLMVATIDPELNKASLLSIPRDTRVRIPGHGYDKINSAFAYGGEKLTQETVEDFLGVSIDHYVIVNVKAFQRIIDAIGGVDINVEKRMYYEDPWDDDGGLIIDLMPGMQHMDGKTAVTYVRYRDEEGDIGRIERQQKFMKACMEKATSPSIIPKLPAVISEIFDAVRTDLSLRQMLEFAGSLKEAQRNGLTTDMVPGRGLYIDGVSYWVPDISDIREALADTLGVTMNSSMRDRIDRAEREYESSIPETATEVPSNDTSIGRPHYYRKVDDEDERDNRRPDSSTVRRPSSSPDDEDKDERNRTNQTTPSGRNTGRNEEPDTDSREGRNTTNPERPQVEDNSQPAAPTRGSSTKNQ